MNRWLLTSAAATVAATAATAQPAAKPGGYVVIRVKLGTEVGDGTTSPANPGGSLPPALPPGPGAGPGRFGPAAPEPILPPGVGAGSGGVPGGAGGGTPATGLNEHSIHVLIPYSKIGTEKLYLKKGGSDDRNPVLPVLTSHFGHTVFFPDKVSVQYDILPVRSETERLTSLVGVWNRSPNRRPAELLGYIGDALRADMLPLAEQFSESLVTQFDKSDSLPADVAAFIKGYKELKAKWNDPLANNPAADTWKAKLGTDAAVYADGSPHYALVHFTADPLSGAVGDAAVRTAEALERNLKCFYLWHLREGFALKLPAKKLVVVLAKTGGQLAKLRDGLDGLPAVADAFYSPQHNLTVLSPERTDPLGRSFAAIAAAKTEGYDREGLLKGVHPPLKQDQAPEDIAVASTYALVKKAVDEEVVSAAVSREASRQLFVSLGVLPRHVRMPKWVEYGMGSLPHHPKGGGVEEVAKDTPGVVVGLFTGHGAANYELLNRFRQLYPAKNHEGKENKALKPAEVLSNVLTDAYFDAAVKGIDPDRPPLGDGKPSAPPPGGGVVLPPGGGRPPVNPGGRGNDAQMPPRGPAPMPGFPGGSGFPGAPGGGTQPGGNGVLDPNAAEPQPTPAQLEQKATATAWALTYYLTKNGKMASLHRYLTKLDELPRDMRVDRQVSKRLFCEVFALLKTNSQEVDAAAFEAFAKDWFTFIQQQPDSYKLIPLKSFEGDKVDQPAAGGTPGFPGGPGGVAPGGRN